MYANIKMLKFYNNGGISIAKKLVSLSLVAALSIGITMPWMGNNVQANELPATLSESSIVPDKIEYITSEKGERIPVIYIADPDKAQKFMEQNGFKKESAIKDQTAKDSEKRKGIQPALFDTYEYVDYVGPMKYDYRVDYTENRTKKDFEWERTVERDAFSETSITVGGEFEKVFKAEVGKKWAEKFTFKDTFTVKIPPKKQGEIWTWNNAKVYKFKEIGTFSTINFTATLVTNHFGNSIVITDFRDPHGKIPK
ncbi:hypothetical protein O0555_04880 [Brevibacillus laterosporus]|uniref:hypothetical protein n=1 Tax=Brevibacillus laterosporus TaxID=1465 RepID=UPI001F558AB3|nr:hypothetical protein [Brevibacillus laterosporus]MCR8936689.1 hypothetical protein [Brevibacillus laterosporus]MCZ0839328.1 hypothetical protein [Brevibacillus laterosporus]MCZ0844192.1 hypothetical protein [Brevibacillus laterosporus]MED1910994.1 hypothetical protein [Brevibacillus laterosporus]